MKDHTSASTAWSRVALAILPGLFVLGSKMNLWQRLLDVSVDYWVFTDYGLLLFCMSLCTLGFFRRHRFPVWSLVSLGIVLEMVLFSASISPLEFLVGLGIVAWAIGAWFWPRIPHEQWERWLFGLLLAGTALFVLFLSAGSPTTRPNGGMLINALLQWPQRVLIFLTISGVVPGIVGLFLARRAGVLTGLVVVGAAYVVWDQIGDPDYALLMWTDNKMLVALVSTLPSLFFLIIVPVAVMRVYTIKARMVGFLFPICIAFASAVIVRFVIRPDKSFIEAVFFDLLFLLLPLTIALTLYARVARDMSSTRPLNERI